MVTVKLTRTLVVLATAPFVFVGASACFIFSAAVAGWSLMEDAFVALDKWIRSE